jgi:nitrate/nitrite-specific signal transduction histidine kinase
VARGDFSLKAKSFSLDEIGILANNFNAIAGELERLEKENREANISLENKVRKRTAENHVRICRIIKEALSWTVRWECG